jgi:hypothetical protein
MTRRTAEDSIIHFASGSVGQTAEERTRIAERINATDKLIIYICVHASKLLQYLESLK